MADSEGRSPVGVAIVVVGSCLTFVYIGLLLRAALRVRWLAAARGLVGSWRVPCWPARTDEDKVLDEKMRETRRANLLAMVGSVVHWWFPAFCGATFVQILANNEEEGSVAVRTVFFTVAFLLYLSPHRRLTFGMLRTWQHICFALACANIAPGICSPDRLPNVSRVSGLVVTATNFALLHAPTSIAQHVLYVLVAGASFRASSLHGEGPSWWRHFSVEIGSACVCCGCVVVAQKFVEALHCSNLEARSLADKQLANNKLLSVFYEVVLEVDSELTILSSEPDLGLLLPRGSGSPPPPLLGTKLDALLPNDRDRRLLQEHMNRTPTDGEASVFVMHLEMRYGGRDGLQVEICSHSFQSPTGGWRHVLGVREFGDEGGAAPGAGEPCLALQVGVFDPSFRISEISQDLQSMLGGPTQGSSLLEVMDDAPDFADRFQEAINTVGNDEDGDFEPSTTFRVVLRPLGQRARLVASCCVSVDAASPVARLTFTGLLPVNRRRTSSSAGSSCSRQLHIQPQASAPPQATEQSAAVSL